jgi:hypothetical protein
MEKDKNGRKEKGIVANSHTILKQRKSLQYFPMPKANQFMLGLQDNFPFPPFVPEKFLRCIGRFHHSPTARVGIFVLLNNSHHYTLVKEFLTHDTHY